MKSFFVALTRNGISLVGTAIVTASALLIVTLFTLGLFGLRESPYIGILAYVVLPMIFVVGLILIPIGIALQRRRDRLARERGEAPPAFPVVDLNDPRTRQRTVFFLALTAVNLVILATATYKGVETMDSPQFCGQACHSVMQPEYTAYQRSPHANVACVSCHIGPGAGWFVKAKLTGTRQLLGVMTGHYPRPVPSPVHNLRPARETCENCHWPSKTIGDRLRVIDSFSDDEANTPAKTVLLMKVGGRQGTTSHGIHWHIDPGVTIRYRSDPQRQTIYEVELRQADGKVVTYAPPEGTKAPAGAVWRTMDCLDCHNRPSHTFRLPEEEVDGALADGRIARDLPFVRREGVRLLQANYPSQTVAAKSIEDGLWAFYKASYPQIATAKMTEIRQAAAALTDGYRANVFPSMKVGWKTYPNNLGHESFPGCFRCHDDQHTAKDGRSIPQDCATCHNLLAMQEEKPEILDKLAQ